MQASSRLLTPGQEEQEFLPAVAAEEVLLADGVLHDPGQLAQELVPRLVPVPVVVVLEPVHVAHDQGRRALPRAGACPGS